MASHSESIPCTHGEPHYIDTDSNEYTVIHAYISDKFTKRRIKFSFRLANSTEPERQTSRSVLEACVCPLRISRLPSDSGAHFSSVPLPSFPIKFVQAYLNPDACLATTLLSLGDQLQNINHNISSLHHRMDKLFSRLYFNQKPRVSHDLLQPAVFDIYPSSCASTTSPRSTLSLSLVGDWEPLSPAPPQLWAQPQTSTCSSTGSQTSALPRSWRGRVSGRAAQTNGGSLRDCRQCPSCPT